MTYVQNIFILPGLFINEVGLRGNGAGAGIPPPPLIILIIAGDGNYGKGTLMRHTIIGGTLVTSPDNSRLPAQHIMLLRVFLFLAGRVK